VAVVRLGGGEHVQPLRVEVPDLDRVGQKGVDRGVLHRVVARPDPGWGAEVRDAGLGADPGAGEDDAGPARPHQLRQPLDRHARRMASVAAAATASAAATSASVTRERWRATKLRVSATW